MSEHDDDYRIELFLFPDGTSVEMIVFDREAQTATSSRAVNGRQSASPARPERPAPQPRVEPDPGRLDGEGHVCPLCACELVYPTDWQRRDDVTWELRLRCPNCETQRSVVMGREGVEQLNRHLYRGAQSVAREAEVVSRRNFEEEAEKLIEALAQDLIFPMDF